MAIEQRSKEFNRNRILQLKSKSQNRSTDSTVDETVSVSASIMLEHSGDSLDDQLGANLSAEVGPNTSTVHEEEEDDVATTVEMEPIFVCPKCSTVSEVEEQLRQQLEAAWAANAEKSKELSDTQNKIAELLEENAALKKAAQQKQKTFDEEKQRLEQQLVNKQKDEEIIAKLVPSKRFTRAQSSIQLSSSIPTTSFASTSQSTTGSMDETTVNGQVLLNTCNRSSSVSTIGENSSPPSLRSSSVFGIFAPVTNLWEDRSTSLVKSPSSSSSSSLTGMPEEASSNGPEVEPSAVVEGAEVDSATVPMHGSEGDWLSPGFSEIGPSPRGRTSCVVFDFPANTLKEQLIKLRLNISELKKCVDARHPTPTTATATATTNTTMIKGEGGDSIESRGVIHSMDSAKLAMK